jgi:hypothetical protein
MTYPKDSDEDSTESDVGILQLHASVCILQGACRRSLCPAHGPGHKGESSQMSHHACTNAAQNFFEVFLSGGFYQVPVGIITYRVSLETA